jgi:hypothetical protein
MDAGLTRFDWFRLVKRDAQRLGTHSRGTRLQLNIISGGGREKGGGGGREGICTILMKKKYKL